MSVERISFGDREAWLRLRQQDVTASDIAVVCGCSPFKTALMLWAEKTNAVPQQDETAIMKRGRHLEDAVINYYRDEYPEHDVSKPGYYLRDPDARIGATPDAIAKTPDGEVILQCKVVAKPIFDREWSDGPPLHYQLQVLTEAMLWGAPVCRLAVLAIDAFGATFKTFDVPRHAGAEQRIRTAVDHFWDDVAAGKQPRADYARDLDLLQSLYQPEEKIPARDLTGDNRMPLLLAEYETLKAEIRERDERIDALKAEAVEKMAGSTLATMPGWKVSNKLTLRKEYTVKASSYPVFKVTRTQEIKHARNVEATSHGSQQGPF